MSRTTASLVMVALLGLACASGEGEVVEVAAPAPTSESSATPSAVTPAPEPVEPAPPVPQPPAAPAKIITKPVSAPAPAPVAPAVPAAPSRAFVIIEGDAKEVLLLPDSQGAQRSSGGDTSPGAYKVKAWFKQPVPVIAANITLVSGERAVIHCSSASKRCEKRQAE